MSELENPFKKLETHKKVPEGIKENVMKELSSIKLIAELGDLFFVKYGSVIESVFTSKKKNRN